MGVARLDAYYVSRIRAGQIAAKLNVQTVRETPTSLLVDAGNGLGHPTAVRTMEHILDKAAQSGAAFGAVRNSNHFGIAGYYAMLSLDRDMIGIASTNSTRLARRRSARRSCWGPIRWRSRSRPRTNRRSCWTLRRRPSPRASSKSTAVRANSSTRAGRSMRERAGDARSQRRAQRRPAATGWIRRRQRRSQRVRPRVAGRHPVRRAFRRRVRQRPSVAHRQPAAGQDLPFLSRRSRSTAFRDPEQFKADMDTELRASKTRRKRPVTIASTSPARSSTRKRCTTASTASPSTSKYGTACRSSPAGSTSPSTSKKPDAPRHRARDRPAALGSAAASAAPAPRTEIALAEVTITMVVR